MCWVLYLPDALSIRMRPASLVFPKNGMTGFVTRCDSLCDQIWLLYSNDTQRGGCLHMLPLFNKYLTVKLTDNLISQSSTGGKKILQALVSHFASFYTRFSKTRALRSCDGEAAL